MSKSKRDILDTESMLTRLTNLLVEHEPPQGIVVGYDFGRPRRDAESLRRISMTLHRWHELECGDSNDYASRCITRGHWRKQDAGQWFEYDDDGTPFIERHAHSENKARYTAIPDRERGALKRLASILKNYPGLQSYVQTDPRGCALYILTPQQMNGVLPEEIDAVYTRGLAVHK